MAAAMAKEISVSEWMERKIVLLKLMAKHVARANLSRIHLRVVVALALARAIITMLCAY